MLPVSPLYWCFRSLRSQISELEAKLASITSAQRQRVDELAKGSKKLNTFSDALASGGKNNAYQFLKGMDEITTATMELWSTVEKGSEEEKMLLKAQKEQMLRLMGNSMGDISEKISKEMEFEIERMNDKIAAIMANEELTEEERAAAIKRIQDEARQTLTEIMMKDAELAPLTAQYI